MKRRFFSWLGMSLVAGTAGVASGDLPGSMPVQNVSQPRILAPRDAGRPVVRRYRSYSIDPGVAVSPVPAAPDVIEAAPSSVRRGTGGRPSKPSYMRGDAKARGQFHR